MTTDTLPQWRPATRPRPWWAAVVYAVGWAAVGVAYGALLAAAAYTGYVWGCLLK